MDLHCENARRVQNSLPSCCKCQQLSLFFKSYSDATRLHILFCMMEGEICVHDMSLLLNMSQPRVSNHLRLLRQDGLVKTRREGNQIFYSLDDSHVHDVLSIGLEHIQHIKENNNETDN